MKEKSIPSRSTPPVFAVCVCLVYVTSSFGGMSVAWTETTDKLGAERLLQMQPHHKWKSLEPIDIDVYILFK